MKAERRSTAGHMGRMMDAPEVHRVESRDMGRGVNTEVPGDP